MKSKYTKELWGNICKAKYAGGFLRQAMPEALPFGIAEKIISSFTDILNSTVLIKSIIDKISGNSDFDSLKPLFFVALGINIIRLIIYAAYSSVNCRMDVILEARLKKIAFERAEKLTYSSQFNQEIKNLIFWSCGSIKGVACTYYLIIVKYVGFIVSFMFNIVLSAVYGGWLALIIVLMILLVELYSQKIEVKKNELNFSEQNERNIYARKKAYFVNSIFLNKENNQSIRMDNNFDFYRNKYLSYSKEDINHVGNYGEKRWRECKNENLLRRVILVALEFAFLCYKLVVVRDISVGALWVLISVFESVRKTCPLGFYSEIHNLALYSDKLKSYFTGGDIEKGGYLAIDTSRVEFEFRNVSYSYPGSKRKALNEVSFKFGKDEMLVILGENGAGKSTLFLLLYRLAEPQSGEILLNGVNIKDYDLNQYRTLFSPMFQDDNIFPMSLGQNVSLEWNYEGYEKQIENALVSSGFGKTLDRLENRLDLALTRRFDNSGYVPSGGEARKIVFSRNLYSNSVIKLFDEYDSNIDPVSEASLNLALCETKGIKILITHRLPIARKASAILVMKDGTVAESGTHSELYEKHGIYFNMIKHERDCVTA